MGFNPFAAGGDYVHNYTTFDDLGIDTHGKTMEEILKEIADMDLPVNTIITGQLYREAAPDERIYNCEGEIQITQGKYGQVYWCRATSASISPYSWNSIYNQTTDEDNPIDNILPWTPTYYQSTEINEIKKKLEELGADWVGRFERDESGNILGEYFNDYENNKATGLYSHTEGSMNVNLGETGHVEGYNNQLNSTEKGSHVEGMENVVEGECNHAEGRGNTVYGEQNHVSGSGNSVNGVGNFVCGASNTVKSDFNKIMGNGCLVKKGNQYIHILGNSNSVHSKIGVNNLIAGTSNNIYKNISFSSILGAENTIGQDEEVSTGTDYDVSHVFIAGHGLVINTGKNKTILGSYNAIDTEDKFALVIGNGTADDARSNAFAVGKTGDIYVKNSDTPIDLAPISMSLLEEICV